MLRTSKSIVTLAVVAWAVHAAVAAPPPKPAAEWIPDTAVIALEISQPKPILELLLKPAVLEAVAASPAYKQQAAKGQFRQLVQGVRFLEAAFDMDWQTGLGKLIGGGVTLAVGPKGATVLILDVEDRRMLERMHEIFLGFARAEAERQGKPERVASADYRGVTGWTFNGQEAHALVENRLILTNSAETLKAVVDRRAGQGASLGTMPAYQAAKKAAGRDAAAVAFVNLDVLEHLPGVKQALASNKNPMATLLWGGLPEALRGPGWLALGLHVDADAVSLSATAANAGAAENVSKRAAFAQPPAPKDGVLPNVRVPRRIAAASLYRNLHDFYVAKDELFPERTSGLIFFENMMGIFFSGKNLTEEVLAEVDPHVRLVVAQQQYDPGVGTPKTQIPAFAMVLRLKHPEQSAETAEEAWQKALGLINFTRGQQGQPGLILDRPNYADIRYSVAAFSTSGIKDKSALDTRFNFQPSLAVVGSWLVLSSAEALTKDLIDALKQEAASPAEPVAGKNSVLELDGQALAAILQANQEPMVRQNMVEKGNTQQQAEAEIGTLIFLLRQLGQASLEVGMHEGQTRATLKLRRS